MNGDAVRVLEIIGVKLFVELTMVVALTFDVAVSVVLDVDVLLVDLDRVLFAVLVDVKLSLLDAVRDFEPIMDADIVDEAVSVLLARVDRVLVEEAVAVLDGAIVDVDVIDIIGVCVRRDDLDALVDPVDDFVTRVEYETVGLADDVFDPGSDREYVGEDVDVFVVLTELVDVRVLVIVFVEKADPLVVFEKAKV